MDDSPVKGLTLSTPFEENNENDEIGTPKLEKSRKVVRKHYMSPTISAATKAAALVPRKKILGDRNEGFTFSVSPKPLIESARPVRSCCGSDNDYDDEQNSFDGGSSLKKKPYDPLTNYLSPRPKFLRYNPNKKHRIFLCEDNEIEKMKDGLCFVSTSSSFEYQKVAEERTFEEGSVKKEDVEMAKTDGDCNNYVEEVEGSEEFEEEEGKKCWSLLGILKFLLVLGSLFLSTSFICSMNYPDPSLIQEAVWEFRGEFVNQSNTHEEVAIRKEYVISGFEVKYGKEKDSYISLLDLVTQQDRIDNEFAEAGISEGNGTGNGLVDSAVGLPEVTIEKCDDVYNDGLTSKVESSATLQWAEPVKNEADTNNEVVDSEAELVDSRANKRIRDQEMGSTEEAFDKVQGAENVKVFESLQEDLIIKPSTDLSGNGNGLLDSTVGWPEVTVEKSEYVYSDGLMSKVETKPIRSRTNTNIEVVDNGAEALDSRVIECTTDCEMGSTDEAFDHVQGADVVEVFESFQEDLFPKIEPNTDLNAEYVMMESKGIVLQLEILALAVSLSIVAALGFLYRARERNIGKKKSLPTENNNGKEYSLPLETQHQKAEPLKADHQIQNSNAICGAKEEMMKKVASVVSPSTTPIPPMKVVTEVFSRQSQAPIVELLGELVIGEEANSFCRSIKRRRVLDSEVKNGSNHHFTQMMISQNKAPLVENQRYSPQLDLSDAADSSSQKKKSVSKKEQEGKGGEVSMASATAVRRSSRIRSKAMSPC